MVISILGCGWLGLPLGEHLRDKDNMIKGSTTTPDKLALLKGKNITPYLINFNPEINKEADQSFWDSDLLILNIPPGRKRDNVETFHEQQIKAIIKQLKGSTISHLIFISSTSVYPPKPGIVTEEDAQPGKAARNSGNALLTAEELLQEQPTFDTTIIRFGGLYGYDRHPVTHLSGRKNLNKGNAPVNLIHQDDCIGIIREIIDQDIRNDVFNGVSDAHPPKRMYYPAVARERDLPPPQYAEDKEEGYKVVSNQKLKQVLNYKFKYPNPMDF